jgi:hypothetical protein
MKMFSHLWQYVAKFFLGWEMFQTEFIEKNQKTLFTFGNFSPKIVPFRRKCRKVEWSQWDRRWKIKRSAACWISKATHEQSHVHARKPTLTHTQAQARTHSSTRAQTHTDDFNPYCFSTARMVSWKRLCVTLRAHCLSCFVLKLI